MIGTLNRKLRKRLSDGDWLPVRSGIGDPNAVAITFDDGPSPSTTPFILDILDRFEATAGFFLCGDRAERHPDLVDAIAARGHAIYSHGYAHHRMDQLSPDAFVADLVRTEAVLARFRPTPSPYLIRLPYGSGHDVAAVHAQLRAWRDDVQIVHWGLSINDWTLADDCAGIADVAARCDAAVRMAVEDKRFGGTILLLHEDAIGATAALSAAIAPLVLETLLRAIAPLGIKTATIPASASQPALARFVRFAAVR